MPILPRFLTPRNQSLNFVAKSSGGLMRVVASCLSTVYKIPPLLSG